MDSHSQISVGFLYPKEKLTEKEIMETMPLIVASKYYNEVLKNFIVKEINDAYNKNYNSLKQESEEYTRKSKDVPCSWTDRSNIMNIATLLKFYVDLAQHNITHRNGESNLKIHMEPQEMQNS